MNPVRNIPEPGLEGVLGIKKIGDYDILEELGRGGMGVVLKARQRNLNRIVAIKMILGQAFTNEKAHLRFRREAELIAALNHPNIVHIYEISEFEGQPFYSMEYIEGITLNELVKDKPLGWTQAARFAQVIAQAMQFAHERGVIHRDLKPHNVMVDRYQNLHLTDFGLARDVNADSGLTIKGEALGTPNYMSPEQCETNSTLSVATDIYSMGAILYEMVTSVPPFMSSNVHNLLDMVKNTAPLEPRRINPSIPRNLNTICLKCLEKSPAGRYPSSGELAEELDRVLKDLPIKAKPVSVLGKTWRWYRRNWVFVVAALLGLGASIWWWDNTRVKTAYYQEISSRWSVPEGITRLSYDKVLHRASSYRVESSRQRVRRVTKINSLGHPVDDAETHHAATEEIHYRETGDLDFIAYLNHNGQEVFRATYSDLRDNGEGGSGRFVDFKLRDQDAPAALASNFSLLEENTTTNNQNAFMTMSNITSEIIDYTADGRNARIQYLDPYRIPHPNGNGILGQHFDYNPLGMVIKIENLGPDGKILSDRQGVMAVVRSNDASGNKIEEAYLGADSRPILSGDGYAKVTAQYDELGNKIEESFFGVDEKPMLNAFGVAKVTYKFDERGNLIEEASFGCDDRPATNKSGYAKVMYKYDERSNPIEWAYTGVDGRPVLNKDGYAEIRCKYDERGNTLEQDYLGIDDQPAPCNRGYAKLTFKYDERGNQIEQAFFGIDGQSVTSKYGYAKLTYKYDGRGNRIEWAAFGVDGQPMLDKGGAAKAALQYDERGNIIEEDVFGIDGHPVLDKDALAKMTYHYDERGNEIEEDYFGVDGKPKLNCAYVAGNTNKYDDRGNLIEMAFFGIHGRPALLDNSTYAKITYKYDEHGNKTEEAYFGVDDRPVLVQHAWARQTGGYTKITYKYDERGNKIEETYSGVDGKPVLDSDGIAKVTLKYDERANVTDRIFWGVDGQPVLNKDGYAKVTTKYNERGNEIEKAYFWGDGLPVSVKNGNAKVTYKYDERNNKIEEAYFGIDDQPVSVKNGNAKVTYKYDERGNMIEDDEFDLDGRFIVGITNGYARATHLYGARGYKVEDRYFGANGKPIEVKGACRIVYTYDTTGKVIKTDRFDTSGKLMF